MALTQADLQAISQLMEPLQVDIQDMRSDMKGLSQRITSLESHLENETDKNIQETAQRLSSLELHIENKTDFNIQLLAENHSNLIHKLNRAIDVHRNDIIFEIDISSLKERVSRIEKNCADRK